MLFQNQGCIRQAFLFYLYFMITIIHNPQCSKSNCSLQYLSGLDEETVIRNYIEKRLSANELKGIVQMLGIKPEELVRKNEELYKQSFSGKVYSDDEWINILAENPVLIERPIIIKNNKAIIGRPFERVAAFLKGKE